MSGTEQFAAAQHAALGPQQALYPASYPPFSAFGQPQSGALANPWSPGYFGPTASELYAYATALWCQTLSRFSFSIWLSAFIPIWPEWSKSNVF